MLLLIAEGCSNDDVWATMTGVVFFVTALLELYRTRPAEAQAVSRALRIDRLLIDVEHLKDRPWPSRAAEGHEGIADAAQALRKLVAVMSSTDEPASPPPSKTAKALQELGMGLEARNLRRAEAKRSDPVEVRKALETLTRALFEKQEGASD